MKLGILGTGNMGSGMWRNLKNKGHVAAVYDLRPEATQPLAAQGAPAAKSARELGGMAQTVIVSLPASRHVEEALLGKHGLAEGAKPGVTVIDTTSGNPMHSRRIAEGLAATGIRYVDAGVSGGPRGADAGTLLVMAGGEKATVDSQMPVLQLLGNRIHYCGGVGAGHAMKTLLNLRNQTVNMVTAEVLLIGGKFGLDPKKVVEVTGAGAIWNDFIMNPAGRKAIGFSIGLASKDEDVALTLAMDLGVGVPVSSTGQQFFRAAMAELGPDADVFRFVDVLERWAKHTLPGSPVKGKP